MTLSDMSAGKGVGQNKHMPKHIFFKSQKERERIVPKIKIV
jgi:hypothetical protein